MQCDRTQSLVFKLLTEGTRRAVLQVAKHRVSARRALNANLMRAAGLEFDFQPRRYSPAVSAGSQPRALRTDPRRVGYIAPQHAITHDRNLAARVAFRNNDRLRHAVSFMQVVGPRALVGLNISLDDRPINLGHRAVFELC